MSYSSRYQRAAFRISRLKLNKTASVERPKLPSTDEFSTDDTQSLGKIKLQNCCRAGIAQSVERLPVAW